jgi:hypothetical protein
MTFRPARPGPYCAAAGAAPARYLQIKHLNRQRHLPPPVPRHAVHFRGSAAPLPGRVSGRGARCS